MKISVVTEFPGWLVILCILTGVAMALLSYYRYPHNEFSKRMILLMAILRGLSVAIIAFLLLSPLLKTITHHTEKPIIILAMDNSESMVAGKDSAFIRKGAIQSMQELGKTLAKKYEVREYSFSDKIQDRLSNRFDGKQSDLGNVFDEINERFSNRNVASLVLVSDGIYNKGKDPLYAAQNSNYSIYTIGTGDTSRQRDLFISRTMFNKITFLGTEFPLEIEVMANRAGNSKSRLTVTGNGKQYYAEDIAITGDHFTHKAEVMLKATESGIQHYRIALAPISGEANVSNNLRDLYVEVINSKLKILLLALSPHPDISAIEKAIENNDNYQLDYYLFDQFNKPLDDYSLVILHQLPGIGQGGGTLFTKLKSANIPVMFIVGQQIQIPVFNSVQSLVTIPVSSTQLNESTANISGTFSSFRLEPAEIEMIKNFPPLYTPMGSYKTSMSADVMAYQKTGMTVTANPLIAMGTEGQHKACVITGEGLWRWRLDDFQKSGNHEVFDNLVLKIVQYLSVREDKSKMRVTAKNTYMDSDPVEMDAEIYNDSYQLVNDPEVTVVIRSEKGKEYPFVFSRKGEAYYFNAGSLPADNYSYTASASYNGKELSKSGKFTVMDVNLEMLNIVADHGLLYNLAKKHNGELLSLNEMNKLPDLLAKDENLKAVSYSLKQYTDLINNPWIFLLIIGLLSAEWFLRKRGGIY